MAEERFSTRDGIVCLLLLFVPIGWLVLVLAYVANRWAGIDILHFIESDSDRAMQYEIERELAKEKEWEEKEARLNA